MSTGPAPEASAGEEAAGQFLARDLATVIAREIEDAGEYRATLDPRDPQRLVDLRWAALAAGRALGRKVQVVMTKAVHAGDTPITARLIPCPPARPTVPSQRAREA